MGVGKGFWDLVKPVARMDHLESLRGKVLAIDLSFWMIQLLTRVKGIALRKPHIRLLFYRTVHLVARVGAFPIFVVDGEPPPLKLKVRLERFSRISGISVNSSLGAENCNTARNNIFTGNIEECVELLELLGMPVLRAKHEAEGLCAELERQGLVNACVTPDSDAFLYGAKHVIKVLQADPKDPHVESYLMSDIETIIGLHREHLVALALLSGCDYNVQGVSGIGCRNAVRLIKTVPKHELFNRLRDWGNGSMDFNLKSVDDIEPEDTKKEAVVNEKTMYHCSFCGHPGTKASHKQIACELCSDIPICEEGQGCRPKPQGFICTCGYCTKRQASTKYTKQKNWKLKVCKKISQTPGFPNEEIIRIFMNPDHDILGVGNSRPSLAWKHPLLKDLERFLEERLHWEKVYVRQKVLPLLSFYCLKDTAALMKAETSTALPSINGIYMPHSIQRIKIMYSKPLYRLRWKQAARLDSNEDWLGLRSLPHNREEAQSDMNWFTSDFQIESCEENVMFTTDEDMLLVKEACPTLVAQFEQDKLACKSTRKGISKQNKVANMPSKQQRRITSFFKSQKDGVLKSADETNSEKYHKSHLDKEEQKIHYAAVTNHRPCYRDSRAECNKTERTVFSAPGLVKPIEGNSPLDMVDSRNSLMHGYKQSKYNIHEQNVIDRVSKICHDKLATHSDVIDLEDEEKNCQNTNATHTETFNDGVYFERLKKTSEVIDVEDEAKRCENTSLTHNDFIKRVEVIDLEDTANETWPCSSKTKRRRDTSSGIQACEKSIFLSPKRFALDTESTTTPPSHLEDAHRLPQVPHKASGLAAHACVRRILF